MLIGIIPARAGFTSGLLSSSLVMTDHPRSRGVYGVGGLYRYKLRGSSPLARGLRYDDHRGPERARIIPARAGFTIILPGLRPIITDHPRSRGVYVPY